MQYALVLMQSWPWITFGDKQHKKNLVNDASVAFSSFRAQRLPSLTIHFQPPFSKIRVYIEILYSCILDSNVSWIYKHKEKQES